MTLGKKALLLGCGILICASGIALYDMLSAKSGFESLSFGVSTWLLFFILPAGVVATLLYGVIMVGSKLLSSKLTSNQKKGLAKRFLIVLAFAASVYIVVYVLP